jgi:ribonuclease D
VPIVHVMPAALWITTNEELASALEMLSGSNFVALDTEFMRERTYYASLCLIQAATADSCVMIDPLSGIDLQPLWEFIGDRRRVKVLHSGRQDLEVLSLAMSPPVDDGAAVLAPVPGPIFDTQIAAALLGSAAQVGYATLVAERLGHTLPKGQTRTDWSRRPLSPEQLEYAADDVRYLVPLYLNLYADLQASGRLDWQAEESLEMENPALYRIDPIDAWRRLKGLDRLRPDQRAVAKLMAQWREARAMRKDKPRGWILADESLREIAERVPSNRSELEGIASLSANFLRKRSEEVLGLIAQGRSNAASEAPAMIPTRPDPRLVARVTKLLAAVRDEAHRSNVAPELLATRRDVEQLVFSGRADHLMEGWRRDVIGQRLVALASESAG